MLELHEEADGKILVANLNGTLTKEDFQIFLPKAERLIKAHGKIRVLCQMLDFRGWELGALWEDVKLDLKHFADVERLAIVGHHKWEAGMAIFCKPFTNSKVRHFDLRDSQLAEEWIWAGLPTADWDWSPFPRHHGLLH
jgi:hypothetical protein